MLCETCCRVLETDLVPCWNHLSPPIDLVRWHRPEFPEVRVSRELGIRYELHPRWRSGRTLFELSLRPARRWLTQHSEASSVLSLFARGCSLGISATAGDAAEIWHVDRDPLALHWGKKSAQLNPAGRRPVRWLQSECTPVMRQLAGLNMQLRGDRQADFLPLEPRRFDRVILDPPPRSDGPFGCVELAKDYGHFFQLALRCTRPGGILLATNRDPSSSREDWLRATLHEVQQLGMEVDFEVIHPEADFPETDAQPALKMAAFERRR